MASIIFKLGKGEKLIITPNNHARTFTIRKPEIKYRTEKFTKIEFENAKHWTLENWEQYLNNSTDYYKVK